MINHMWTLAAAFLGMALALPSPVTFHLVNINEVYSNSDGTLQYVELAALSNFQTNLGITRITSLNANGTMEQTVFDFTGSFQWRQDETMLLATRAFESVAGFAPDFVIPDGSISVENGRVVFRQDTSSVPIDAVAYGAFTGSNSGFGSPAPALPRDGLNSLTRISDFSNNSRDFVVRVNSPRRRDGRTATLQGGGYMLALLSNTDEFIRFELATGDIVQRVPAGFDVKNSSGIDIGTAPGVNGGKPFVVVTQVNQDVARLYDADTLMEIGQINEGQTDIGWHGVGFDGTNWIFSAPDGVVGDETFQGADLINMTASVMTGTVVKLDSVNLNMPDGTFDVFGGMGVAGPGVAVVTGRTGSRMGGGDRSLIRLLINQNRLMAGQPLTTEAGHDGAQPGVSGPLISRNAGHVLISVPGSPTLRIVNPTTGQQVGMLTINELDFSDAIGPDNAISGLSSETTRGSGQ